MAQSHDVFDLGEIGGEPATANPFPRRPARPRDYTVERPLYASPPRGSLSEQLSLFVPGAGQLARGSWAMGLLYLSTLGWILALGWAVLATMDRLPPTLEALGLPRQAGVWTLALCYAGVSLLHVVSVLAPGAGAEQRRTMPPWLVGTASFLVPGWGQLLNGDRKRAAVFVTGLWCAGALWLLASPAMAALLARHELVLPEWIGPWTTPVARFSLPVVLWTLAVYDAAVSASHRR